MEPGYFRSREFAVAGVLALIVLVGGPTGAVLSQGFGGFLGGSPCDTTGHGSGLSPQLDTGPRVADGRTERRVEYVMDEPPGHLPVVALCTEVGTIRVAPHENETVHVVLVPSMEGAHPDAVDAVRLVVSFDATGRLYVQVPQAPRDDSLFQEHDGHVGIEVRIPMNTSVGRLVLAGDVGDRHVQGLTLGHLHNSVDVGDVLLANLTIGERMSHRADVGDLSGSDLHLFGSVEARSDVGNIELAIAAAGNGSWRFFTDVGDVFLEVPHDERYGYRVDIRTDVGTARADLGNGTSDRRSSGASDDLEAETAGFDTRAVQIVIVIRTDVGSGTVQAS